MLYCSEDSYSYSYSYSSYQWKISIPPLRKEGELEITEHWDQTPITAEHIAGVGKCNRRRQDSNDGNNNGSNTGSSGTNLPPPQANLAESPPTTSIDPPTPSTPPQANIAVTSQSTLDFL